MRRHAVEVTALHLAASMGLAKVASVLLKENPNINAVDETGKTALTVAIERGFEKAVELLINSGASVDLHQEHGQGVLLLAAEKKWNSVSAATIQRASASAGTDDFCVHLLVAAHTGSEQQVQSILHGRNVDVRDRDQKLGAVALFLAAEGGHVLIARALLDAGLDVNSRDVTGQSSLHRATRRGDVTMMQFLLSNGAAVDGRNNEGRTPWSANVHSKQSVPLKALLEAGADPNTKGLNGVSELYSAAAGGDAELVKFMLESGTNPSIRTDFDWAPMHWAAYCGHVECVKLLVEAGAELNTVSDQGLTPLDMAYDSKQSAIVDILLSAGAKRSRDIVAETPKDPKTGCAVESPDPADEMALVKIGGSQCLRKLTLSFDQPLNQSTTFGQFIYLAQAADGDHILPYQISHPLDTRTKSISVRRAQQRAVMREYPLAANKFVSQDRIYDIISLNQEYQEMKIEPKATGLLTGTIMMRRGWSGSWKAHQKSGEEDVLLFRTQPNYVQAGSDRGSTWTLGNGQVVGQTFGDGEHSLSFEANLSRNLLHGLVACWIAKTWCETLHHVEA